MRNRTKALLVALVVAITCGWEAQAQSKPNVTGTWNMNLAKSKFAEGGPQKIVIKFEQKDASLQEWFTIGGGQGERTLEFTYKTDGSQNAVTVDGRDVKTMAKWEGDSLLIVTTIVDDRQYLTGQLARSTHFKKLPDASGWDPKPCTAR